MTFVNLQVQCMINHSLVDIHIFVSPGVDRPLALLTHSAGEERDTSRMARLCALRVRLPQLTGTRWLHVVPDITIGRTAEAAALRNHDKCAVSVVTAANRGIGLEFVNQLLHRTSGSIIAGCRTPDEALELQQLAKQHRGRLQLYPLHLESQDSIEEFQKAVAAETDRVDLLLNVAGVLHDKRFPKAPERALEHIDREWLTHSLQVNTIGPLMLTQALKPLLKRRPKDRTRPQAVVANISARVGSISDNGLGGWYSYRISKAGELTLSE